MPSPSELQSMLPLFLQLLFFAVAGALIVGTFVSIIGFMFRHALIIIILIILTFFLYNYEKMW
tara:strand:- start:53 stop:241 length:189 start_codon:yes stop_codon:yes gene_type:complete